MSRRVSLPGAAELFRVTGGEPAGDTRRSETDPADAGRTPDPGGPAAAGTDDGRPAGRPAGERGDPEARGGTGTVTDAEEERDDDAGEDDDWAGPARAVRPRRRSRAAERRPTGRERHEEKITVYCSAEELIDLEHARLTLRGDFGLAVDRGRIVREAVAVVIADLEAKGPNSILVRRLRGRS